VLHRSTKGIVTVVDIVASTANADEFPGIYADHLDETCWSDDNKRVVFSSLWRSRMELVMVHVETGQVTRLSNDLSVGSWSLLDIRKDLMLVVCSSPSQPPYLVIGKLPSVGEPAAVKWLRLDSEPEPLPQVCQSLVEWYLSFSSLLMIFALYLVDDQLLSFSFLTLLVGSSFP